MRVTYSCPACEKKGFNARTEFIEHVKTHGDDVVADVNQKLEAAKQILEEESG
jgi:hypothetical protein